MIGPEGDITDASNPRAAARLELLQPLLTRSNLEAVLAIGAAPSLDWTATPVDATWAVEEGAAGLQPALRAVCAAAAAAVDAGAAFIVLTDRATSPSRVAIPPLLAVGAVHHHLVALQKRARVGLIVDAAEPRDVHHFCALLGFGADAICPSLALDALTSLAAAAGQPDATTWTDNFFYAVNAGLLKTQAKMGVSCLASYKGAQIFEAVGLGPAVMDAAFAGTPSRVGGLDFAGLGADALALHAAGWRGGAAAASPSAPPALLNPGDYAYRNGAPGTTEAHLNHPAAIADLQAAARTGGEAAYRAFADRTDALNKGIALRGLIAIKPAHTPLPLDAVEPAADIVKRFVTGAMSYGSISLEVS